MLVAILVICGAATVNDLALRAYAYAMNRVVFGHHLKSDIDAGQMLAAVISDLPLSSDKFENVNNN